MSIDEGTWVRRMPVADEVALIRKLAQKRTADASDHQPSACLCESCRMRWTAYLRRIRNGKAARRQAPEWVKDPAMRESYRDGFVSIPGWEAP